MPLRATSDGPRISPPASFRHDREAGAIFLPDDRRILAFSAPMIRGLHVALIDQLGETAQDGLYRIGYEWALQDMLRLAQRMRQEFGHEHDLGQMDAKFVLESWWTPLHVAGWGVCTFDTASLSRGLVFADVQHSIVAATLGGADQPMCHLYAGLFGGAVSFYERAERHAVEVQCAAMSGDTCKFIVGPGAEVDSAEAWRQQGAPVADIVRRLR